MDTSLEELQPEANSSWTSLVCDDIRNSSTYEDVDSEVSPQSLSSERRSQPRIDSKTLEHVLQVLVQREVMANNLRLELDNLREEHKQEIEHRDARIRSTEAQLDSLRNEYEVVAADNEALNIKLASLRATDHPYSRTRLLSVDEHKRIVQRVEAGAKALVDSVEAEKTLLVVQLKKQQIQAAQLRNQMDERSCPEDFLQDLVKNLKYDLVGDSQAQHQNKEKDEKIATLEHELRTLEKVCTDYKDRCKTLKEHNKTLNTAFNNAQIRLEDLQERLEEIDDVLSSGELEMLRERVKEKEALRVTAMLECDDLRLALSEAEENHMKETKETYSTISNLRSKLLDVQNAHESATSELGKLKDEHHSVSTSFFEATSTNNLLRTELEDTKAQLSRVILSEKVLKQQIGTIIRHLRRIESVTRPFTTVTEDELTSDTEALMGDEECTTLVDKFISCLSEAVSEKNKLKEEVDSISLCLSEASIRGDQLSTEIQRLNKELTRAKLNSETEKPTICDESRSSSQPTATDGNCPENDPDKTSKFLMDANSRIETLKAEMIESSSIPKETTSKLRNDKEEMEKKLQELVHDNLRVTNDLKLTKAQYAEIESQLKSQAGLNINNQAKLQRQLDELRTSLKESRRLRAETLRENEKIRLALADSEGDRAEVSLHNEELLDRLSTLETELEALNHEIKHSKAQLIETEESKELLERQYSDLRKEVAELTTKILMLEADNERLKATRQKMAAIYGIPTSPTASPDRVQPPLRNGSLARSPSSSSPSTGLLPVPAFEVHTPPKKRKRLSKIQTWVDTTSLEESKSSDSSSMATVIMLDDEDLPSEILHTNQRESLSQETVAHTTVARVATWLDNDESQCGFCNLNNANYGGIQHPPLTFNALKSPIMFWNHCIVEHKDALRPDPQEYLKSAQTFPEGDAVYTTKLVLSKLVSWKNEEEQYVCGLCRLEGCTTPECPADTNEFYMHCRLRHRPFFKD